MASYQGTRVEHQTLNSALPLYLVFLGHKKHVKRFGFKSTLFNLLNFSHPFPPINPFVRWTVPLLHLICTCMTLCYCIKSKCPKEETYNICPPRSAQYDCLQPHQSSHKWCNIVLLHGRTDSIVCLNYVFFTHPSVVDHLGWLHNLASVNTAAVNTHVQSSLRPIDVEPFGWKPKSVGKPHWFP